MADNTRRLLNGGLRWWRGRIRGAPHGIGSTPYGKDRFHSAKHKVVTGVIESALQAEPEGYDAVAMINTFDHGYYEFRELMRIPVAFITESTLHLACQMAPKVAVIGHNDQIRLQVEALGERYGLAARMVAGESLDLTYDDFPEMYVDPAAYLERFRNAARAAMARGLLHFSPRVIHLTCFSSTRMRSRSTVRRLSTVSQRS